MAGRALAAALTVAGMLAGCGGGAARTGAIETVSASGPVRTACLAGGRKAADARLCGCVQAVADARFSGGEQRRIAGFFSAPHTVQEMRQSDRRSDEAFWERWKAFGDEAEQICRGAAAI